ncbi:MATE family efflux transporter [Pseudomonas proteolytica]|nr:MATE family efflux transporter [Pseudomonas proteolytica]
MVGLNAAQPGAWRADSRALLLLALPLILTNLAYVALTTIDIVVLGTLGAKELAAGGLALALFNQLRTTGTGLVTGVSNLVAQANARGDEAQVRALLVAGLFWATVSGLVFMGVLLGLRQPLTWLGQDASVVANAMDFLLIIAPGLLPCLWFQALRHFTVGLKFPGPLLAITLVSIFLTAALNYVLVFGKFGVPAYGLAGVAITSAVVFLLSFLMFLAVVLTHRRLAGYFKLAHLRFSPDALKAVWKLGLPIAGTYASEAGFFSVLTLLIGTLGMEALAAQTVLNQIIYIVFMFSAGISHAASIHISEACGTGQYQRARQLGRLGLGLGVLVMLLFAIPLRAAARTGDRPVYQHRTRQQPGCRAPGDHRLVDRHRPAGVRRQPEHRQRHPARHWRYGGAATDFTVRLLAGGAARCLVAGHCQPLRDLWRMGRFGDWPGGHGVAADRLV